MAKPAVAPETRHSIRRNRRSSRKSVLDLSLVTVEMKPAGFGLMLDVSEEGLGVQVMNKIQPGTQVQIKFEVPDSSERVEAAGVVTWYDGEGRVGVRFQEMKGKNTEALRRWIATLPEATTYEAKAPEAKPQQTQQPVLIEQVRAIQTQIAAAHLNVDLVLQFLVERVVELTNSTGGAIALGTMQEMICRASTGLAPEVGVKISSDSALTAECLRTSSTIRCTDTETDPRVDREICRQLKLRSLLILPVQFEGKIRGVLEVFAPLPNAFSDQHLAMLQQLAEFTSQIVYGPSVEEQPVPPVVTKPVEHPAAVSVPVAPKKEAVAPPNAATVPPVSKPTVEEIDLNANSAPLANRVPSITPQASLGELADAEEEKSGHRKLILPLAALIILLVIAGWWFKSNTNLPSPQPQAITQQQEVPAPVGPEATAPSPVVDTPTVAEAKPPARKATVPSLSTQRVDPEDLVEDSVRPAPINVAPSTAPLVTAASKQDVPVEAPSVTSFTAAGNLSALKLPGVTSTPRLEEAGITGGTPVHQVKPVYPMSAREKHVEGDVVIAVRILKNGMVGNVRKISGDPVLANAAADAVRRWRYAPFKVNGEAQSMETTVTVQFRLPSGR